jgi:exosome complex exonuclease RRP6
MRNELVAKSDFSNPEKNKVQDVLNKSKETALQRYEHPIYDSELGLGSAGWHLFSSPLSNLQSSEQYTSGEMS